MKFPYLRRTNHWDQPTIFTVNKMEFTYSNQRQTNKSRLNQKSDIGILLVPRNEKRMA